MSSPNYTTTSRNYTKPREENERAMIRAQCTTTTAEELDPAAWHDWPAASSPPTLDELAALAMAHAADRRLTPPPHEALFVAVYYYDTERDPTHASGAPARVHGHTCTLWPQYPQPRRQQETAEL